MEEFTDTKTDRQTNRWMGYQYYNIDNSTANLWDKNPLITEMPPPPIKMKLHVCHVPNSSKHNRLCLKSKAIVYRCTA